jgi:cyclic pyranopterin phosphate synthase
MAEDPRMVDVGDKPETRRRAVAEGRVRLSRETLAAVLEGRVPKGDVLAVARVAGIQAAKRTPDLVPLCHPLRLTAVEVDLQAVTGEEGPAITVRAEVEAFDRTGVEMEALSAVAAAALTVYDMLKGLERGIVIERIRLEEKSGGRSGTWRREDQDG